MSWKTQLFLKDKSKEKTIKNIKQNNEFLRKISFLKIYYIILIIEIYLIPYFIHVTYMDEKKVT